MIMVVKWRVLNCCVLRDVSWFTSLGASSSLSLIQVPHGARMVFPFSDVMSNQLEISGVRPYVHTQTSVS
jgi:hypothetical protein